MECIPEMPFLEHLKPTQCLSGIYQLMLPIFFKQKQSLSFNCHVDSKALSRGHNTDINDIKTITQKFTTYTIASFLRRLQQNNCTTFNTRSPGQKYFSELPYSDSTLYICLTSQNKIKRKIFQDDRPEQQPCRKAPLPLSWQQP